MVMGLWPAGTEVDLLSHGLAPALWARRLPA